MGDLKERKIDMPSFYRTIRTIHSWMGFLILPWIQKIGARQGMIDAATYSIHHMLRMLKVT